TDLRSTEEVAQVKQELVSELSGITGEPETVYEINQTDISLFNTFTTSLNPDELFKKVFVPSVQGACFDLKASINIKISAFKSDKVKNKKAVEELRSSLTKIENKKKKLIENAKANSFVDEAEAVANAVGMELNSQLDSLASIAVSGDNEAVKEEINSIVKQTVIAKANTILTSVTTKFANEFSKETENLASLLEQYNSSEVITKLQDNMKNFFDSSANSIKEFISEKQKKSSGVSTSVLTAAAGIFSVATTLVAPIIEILIIALPTIINFLFGKASSNGELEKAKQAIVGQIPKIKREVREKVSQVLMENSSNIITSICDQYDGEIKQKALEIEEASQEMDKSKDIEQKIAEFQSCLLRVEKLLEQIIV
ncbi:MAG: hypothetical protein ACRC5H_05890, partial [Treponemataceae bacterium]